jgi:hypothetical protein
VGYFAAPKGHLINSTKSHPEGMCPSQKNKNLHFSELNKFAQKVVFNSANLHHKKNKKRHAKEHHN